VDESLAEIFKIPQAYLAPISTIIEMQSIYAWNCMDCFKTAFYWYCASRAIKGTAGDMFRVTDNHIRCGVLYV